MSEMIFFHKAVEFFRGLWYNDNTNEIVGGVGKIKIKVARQAKDILQKYASELFKTSTLDFYGIKMAKIKEAVNVELPVVEVADSSTDFIFLLVHSF